MKNNKKIKWLIPCLIVALWVGFLFFALLLFKKFSFQSLDEVKESVVMIEVYDESNEKISTGSGVCVYDKNYIVTNFHVVEGAFKIKVITNDKREIPVDDVLIMDNTHDLVLLSAKVDLEPVKIGDSDKAKTGHDIYTIGSPLGELNTVSEGIISNADNEKGFQISAPISHGSSGGALFNKKNELIGITYAGYDEAQNLNFAIDIKHLKNMYVALKEKNYDLVTDENSYEYYGLDFEHDSKDELKMPVGKKNKYNDGCIFSEEDVMYVRPDSIDTFYYITNNYKIMAINAALYWGCHYTNGGDGFFWFERYIGLDLSEQDLVADFFEELIEYETCVSDTNKCDNSVNITSINSWTNYQFVLETDIITRFGLAVFLAETKDFQSKKEFFDYVCELDMNVVDKAQLLILFGGYSPSDLANEDAESIVDYYADSFVYNDSETKKLLQYLGYRIDGDMVYW